MSHIAITADIHAGVPGRLADTDWALRVVTAYCQRQQIDTVIDLGDLTHDRVALGIDVLCMLYDRLRQAQQLGQQWYTFPGNHNMYLKHSWDINSLRPLSGVLQVIEDVKLLELDDRRFWVLPFIHLEQGYMRVLRRIEQQCQEEDCLFTHVGVRGSTLNTCFLLKDWSFVSFEDTPFRRVYTGHFHSYQQLGRLWYPGSLIPFKFDEGDVPHGFFDLDLETMEHRFVDIWQAGRELLPGEPAPPQFMTVLDQQLEGLTPPDLAGNMVRVALTRDTAPGERAQYKSRLLQLGAKAVYWLDSAPDTAAQRTAAPQQAIRQPGELFLRWAEQDNKGTAGLDRRILLEKEQEVRIEGDERYQYVSHDAE